MVYKNINGLGRNATLQSLFCWRSAGSLGTKRGWGPEQRNVLVQRRIPVRCLANLSTLVLRIPVCALFAIDCMALEAQGSVIQLADQLVHGFTAWSVEYHALWQHQKQLESKLSWAKQQVSYRLVHSTNLFPGSRIMMKQKV